MSPNIVSAYVALARCASIVVAMAMLLSPAAALAQDEGAAGATSDADHGAAVIEEEAIDESTEIQPRDVAMSAPEEIPDAPPQEPAAPAEEPLHDIPVQAPGRMADGSLDPCATDLRSRPMGPLSVSALDGQLGMPSRACPRMEVAIGADVLLVADASRFYGNIRASGRFRVSALLDPNVEGFVSWEAFRYQTVLSSINASYVGLGYLSYGVIARVLAEQGHAVAVTGRFVLPTTTGLDQSSQPLALDLGLTTAWQADANFSLHMWLTLLGSIGVGDGPAAPRGGLRAGGGVDWRPFEWISFVLEVQSGFGYLAMLDLIAAQAGVRLALGTEVGLELAASMPLAGERAFDSGALPLAAALTLSWLPR